MTTRSFPALGFDPAPGTLSSAEAVAERVRTTAARIRETADVLGGTGRQDWQGETATAFHETMSTELTPRVVTAAESFETAAAALETWASSLLNFQQQAEDLETRATAAVAAVSTAADDLSAAQQSEDPEVDTDRPANRLAAATTELEQVRSEAYALADVYAGEAGYVASCLADAGDAAPDSGWWDTFTGWAGTIEDWVQDYLLPVLEDIIEIVAIVVAVAAVIAFVLAAPAGGLLVAGLVLGVASVSIDFLQWAGGREDATEFLVGLGGLAIGGVMGQVTAMAKQAAKAAGGLFGGWTPVLAGVSGGTGGGARVATLGLQWDWMAAFANGGYVMSQAAEETRNVHDTVDGMNDAGNAASRTGERIWSLFQGQGFTTAEQRRDISAREGGE